MSSIMRARSGLTRRSERLEGIGGFLSRAEGCWTFDARDRMPQSSRPTAHRLANSPQAVARAPPARAGSFLAPLQTFRLSRTKYRPRYLLAPLRHAKKGMGPEGL